MEEQKMSDRDLKQAMPKAFKKGDLKIYALDEEGNPIKEDEDKGGECCICKKRIDDALDSFAYLIINDPNATDVHEELFCCRKLLKHQFLIWFMRESKAGHILLLISGIITLLISIGLIIFSILVFAGVVEGEGSVALGGTILLVFGIVALILAILKFWASRLMKVPETTHKGGVIALIVGFLTGGDLLSIVGGILGIVHGGKNN